MSFQRTWLTVRRPLVAAVIFSISYAFQPGDLSQAQAQAGTTSQAQPGTTSSPLSPCTIQRATQLSAGGDQSWSHALELIAYAEPDSSGNNQLRTIRPDGTKDTCLSCRVPAGAPRVDRHKANPTWHPSGKWIVLQAESDWHPLVWLRNAWTKELVINGMSASLWAVSADGKQWHRLTTEEWPTSYGSMSPHFSWDGKRVLWSRIVEPNGLSHPWGKFRLMMADFVLDSSGRPSLKNERDLTPAGHVFVESHGFSPNGAEVLFTSHVGNMEPWNMDIWKLNLTSGKPTRMTPSRNWDEHATFSPTGKKIVYMAGELGVGFFSAELMVMNADGSDKQRLTSFNFPGNPGFTGERTMVMRPTFDASGTRMAVMEQLARGYPAHRRMWVLQFAGPCGGED